MRTAAKRALTKRHPKLAARLREIQGMLGPIVREEVVKFGKHPWDINNGECEDFAVALANRLKTAGLEAWDNGCPDELPGHCWVTVKVGAKNQLHVDAETPFGEPCFLFLPIFLRHLVQNPVHPGPWTEGELALLGETKLAAPLLDSRPKWWEDEIETGERCVVVENKHAAPGRYVVESKAPGTVTLRPPEGRVITIPSWSYSWGLELGEIKRG